MLSRLALRNVQVLPAGLRAVQNVSMCSEVERPKRLVDPSPVRHGFIPEEWFTFFYSKTGASGPYVFMATFGTYLLSKEIYVLEHEFYNSLSLILIGVYGINKFGPTMRNYLDKQREEYAKELMDEREESIQEQVDIIEGCKDEIMYTEAQALIYDARKQNVLMQLEACYRERLAQVYSEVKKRLDYHAQVDTIERRIAQKHMVQWILGNVLKAITPDQEKATLQQCITDLQALAGKA